MSEGRHMCMYMWPRVMWQQCYVTPCHVPWDVKQVVVVGWWVRVAPCATVHPVRYLSPLPCAAYHPLEQLTN